MDSKTRIKDFINQMFPEWEKIDYTEFGEEIEFNKDLSELFRINDEEIVLISYTNISITGTERSKPQLRVFLNEYKKPFYFAKKHHLRYYLFSIFTKEDEMARGLDKFNPKEYIISIETNLDNEDARRDLRSIYDYANENLKGRKFLKCTRANYNADINQASFIYIGSVEAPDKTMFENFVNIFDSRPYLNSTNDSGSVIDTVKRFRIKENQNRSLITALQAKPFMLLAGISGTGKSRLVREFAFKSCPSYLQDKDQTTPGNFCMIEVKPNWHDSTELLGYYSNLNQKYIFTKFVRFLVKAMMYPNVPFFVCLDEMNLAPVEQYFAELLSVIETRKKVGARIETGRLVEPQYFSNLAIQGCNNNSEVYMKLWETVTEENMDASAKVSTSLVDKGLTLPDNVFIIGTVNMDDTTHQFSRKVIDRAMTIEMNGGNLADMFGGSRDLEYYKSDDDVWPLETFKSRYVNADEVIRDCQTIASSPEHIKFVMGKDADGTTIDGECLPKRLKDLNSILENTPFQVSYRVFNELVIYLGVLLDKEKDMDFDNAVDTAVDQILLMKVLPRIEGDEDMFRTADPTKNRLQQMMDFVGEESQSYKKLDEMNKRLSSGFTRFWP